MRSPSLFLSALYWPHCSGVVQAVVRGAGGGQDGIWEEEGGWGGCRTHSSPPSGIAIILQTECHALQTADKKTVTTVGW